MSLKQQLPYLIEQTKKRGEVLFHNNILFNIFEGDLLTYVEQDLKKQLSDNSFQVAKARIVPINVLKKIVDKLSEIYSKTVVRTIENGSEQDSKLLAWYESEMNTNHKMNLANEALNLYKNTLIQPYVHEKKPKLRFIPSDRFVAISLDPVEPTKPTHLVILDGQTNDGKQIYSVYSKDEYLIVDSDFNILTDRMNKYGNPEGKNVFGKLPFVYVNLSDTLLMPIPDTDTLKMTKIIPILLSDLNYSVMFQAFSVIYGVDLDEKNLHLSPNAFWSFKSDPSNPTAKPEVGVIKPQVDIDAVLGLIVAELNMWLESKGLKISGAGEQTAIINNVSGFSKALDEIDATSQLDKQMNIFKSAEFELWDLICHTMHPYWVSTMQIEQSALFTPASEVCTEFIKTPVAVNRGQLVKDLKEEMMAGFISRRQALKILNPEMDDKELDKYIAEIDKEMTVTIPEMDDEEMNGEGN